MRAAISLLVLLFSMCGAQTQSTQTEVSKQVDIYAELKELRDMVVEQRTILKYTQDELKKMEAENAAVKESLVASETKAEAQQKRVEALEKVNDAQGKELAAQQTELAAVKNEMVNMKMENAAVKERLVASETKVVAQQAELTNVKTENAAQQRELAAVMTRLAASEAEVANIKMETAAMSVMKTEVMNLTKQSDVTVTEVEELKTKLATTETGMVNLENTIRAAPKVAFSAALKEGYTQSGATSLNVVFPRVITNVGGAYSSVSGFFTAPVRGVYYFRFTAMDILRSHWMVIHMHKNGELVLGLAEYETDNQQSYLSSGVTLQLEEGDEVNMVLIPDRRLYDNSNKHSTFSGFLLFPL